MAKEQYVNVINIKNGVKRSMNVNSFKLNQKNYRLADGESLENATDKKKEVVGPVENKPLVNESENVTTGGTNPAITLNVDADDISAFPPVTDASENTTEQAPDLSPEALLNGLRAQYLEKFGKEADKRFSVQRLTKEING